MSRRKKQPKENRQNIIGMDYKYSTSTHIDCNYKDFGDIDCKMTIT